MEQSEFKAMVENLSRFTKEPEPICAAAITVLAVRMVDATAVWAMAEVEAYRKSALESAKKIDEARKRGGEVPAPAPKKP